MIALNAKSIKITSTYRFNKMVLAYNPDQDLSMASDGSPLTPCITIFAGEL